MDFAFSAEQRELGTIVRAFLAEQWDEAATRRLFDDPLGWEPKVWRRAATELGIQGIAVPEEFGGAGYGAVELGVVFEELGRAVVGGPFLASVALATTALLTAEDEQAAADLLPGLAAGETVATLALVEASGSWRVADVRTEARHTSHGWRLCGTKEYVLDGAGADLVLVVADAPEGPSLFAVEPTAAGDTLVRTPLDVLDPARRQARVELRDTPARLIGVAGEAARTLRPALLTATALLTAEQVGTAAAALDTAVEYAGFRTQFGRPIGSFQAVKHKCADMLLRLEAARSASAYALWAAADSPQELPRAVPIAKNYCSQAVTFCAGQCMQIHGGIGFSWEHPAHLFLKRAKSTESLLGSPQQHRAALADAIGL